MPWSTTGGSVPSILVGVPGGAPEAATVLDGFAMAKKGEAAEALGASMAASGVGGALGAVAYFLLLPAFARDRTDISARRNSSCWRCSACRAVATLSEGSIMKGFAMGALGLLAGTVGLGSRPPRRPATPSASWSCGMASTRCCS